MTSPGETTLKHVVLQKGVVATPTPPRPARFHCPKRDQPRPGWLPPDKFCCSQDHYLQGTYGITCDQWWEQYALQGGRCGICGQRFRPGQRVVVDHDHDTGAVDGLACFGCNRGLRQEQRRYVKNPPGRHLGLRVAPAKLRAIQAKDAVSRRREREHREQAKTRAAGNGSAATYQDKLRAMTKGGVAR